MQSNKLLGTTGFVGVSVERAFFEASLMARSLFVLLVCSTSVLIVLTALGGAGKFNK